MPTKKDDVYGDHISHKFNDELMELKTEFLKMGGMVEAQVDNAILALVDGDGHLADEIRANDKKVDRMEVEIDEEATLIIARRQPTARDLRRVISVIRKKARPRGAMWKYATLAPTCSACFTMPWMPLPGWIRSRRCGS